MGDSEKHGNKGNCEKTGKEEAEDMRKGNEVYSPVGNTREAKNVEASKATAMTFEEDRNALSSGCGI